MNMNINRKLIKPNPGVVIIRKIKRGRGIMEPPRIISIRSEKAINEDWSPDLSNISYCNIDRIEDNNQYMSEPSEQHPERLHHEYILQNNTGNLKQTIQSNQKRSRITPNQKRILIQYMGQHNDFAMGNMKGELEMKRYQTMWEFLKSKLNICGPPKSVKQWKLAWKAARKRNRLMMESCAKGQNVTWKEFDKELFAIMNKNPAQPIESNRTVSHPVSPSCIVLEDLEETSPDNDFGTDSIPDVDNSISNSFIGDMPQVTQVDSLAAPTKRTRKSREQFQNISDDVAEDKAYLDLMSETNKGLEAISKSIQNLAQAQTELQKIESDRNTIFKNCLSVFQNIALNMKLMSQPKQERTLNEYDDIE